MNLKERIQHNVNCWKSEIISIEEQINILKGRKEGLEDTVECLELIMNEKDN